jgi:hypothetical protein
VGADAPVDPGFVAERGAAPPDGGRVVTLLRRIALVVIAASTSVVGVWAQLFPRSFYDDFPGLGRHWVAMDGPYNQHLIRDVGGLNLALAAVAIWALVSSSVLLARAAGLAGLLYGVPHLAYHSGHLAHYDSVDKVGNVVSLSAFVVVAVVALAAPSIVQTGHDHERVRDRL